MFSYPQIAPARSDSQGKEARIIQIVSPSPLWRSGAGKTTLLNRYREVAVKNFNFLLTDCDERQRDVPAVPGRFAHQLAEQDIPLEHFDKRYKTYRQKMHEIENDPEFTLPE